MEQRKLENEATVSQTFTLIAGCIILAIVIGVALAWIIGNGIANPIIAMTNAMKVLAGGDKSIEINGQERSDEIGDMAGAVQFFKESMIEGDRLAEEQKKEQSERNARAARIEKLTSEFDTSASTILNGVDEAAGEMNKTAISMTSIAEQTIRKPSLLLRPQNKRQPMFKPPRQLRKN